MGDLEALEAITALSLLTDDVEDGVDELGTLGIVALSPVVTGSGLSKDEVVGSEELSEGSSADGIHSTGLEVHQDGSGDIAATSGFVVVDINSFKLKIGVTVVGTSWVNSMLIGDDFPELSTNLVTALTGLNVDNFTHYFIFIIKGLYRPFILKIST